MSSAAARREVARAKRARLERVRITRVGVGYILIALIVGVAAANTGNNALYLVEAALLALLAVSGFVSRSNLRGLEVELLVPSEIYANQAFSLGHRLRNRDRLFAKRLLEVSVGEESGRRLVPWLGRRGERSGTLPALFPGRGRRRITGARLASLFPLGLFHKTMRYRLDLEVLVLPEIYPASEVRGLAAARSGDRESRRAGAGHELLSLRRFRAGDDPRGIHWKQTARTGGLIFMERETEDARRLAILFDNGCGELANTAERARFERLVSEAASAADHHLEKGFEVELVTRGGAIPFGRGRAHKLRILETLALVEPVEPGPEPLALADSGSPVLRLGMLATPGTPEKSAESRGASR